MGATSNALAGTGAGLGAVAAAGMVASAFVAKWWPPRGAAGMGGAVENLGSRDGFYALLLVFIALRAGWPAALPALMVVVALGAHAYWIARAALTLLRRA
jgi:hypothetical protein